MIITTKAVYDIETGKLLAWAGYEYDGPLWLCDRAAQTQATNAGEEAQGVAGTEQAEAQGIQGTLTPTLEGWLTAQHSMSPTQLNEMLTFAGAGTGGATGALGERTELEAARTGNTAGFQSSLDAMAQNRQQALAKASEGIAAQDVQGALARQQMAAGELGKEGEVDTSAALKAMGLQTEDINAEVEAGKSGWFQNMTGLIKSLQGAGASGGSAFGV